MSENEKKTVKIKLERHLWPDEMRERQRRKQVTALMIASLAVVFIVGFLLGGTLHPVRSSAGVGGTVNQDKFAQGKLDSIYSICLLYTSRLCASAAGCRDRLVKAGRGHDAGG